MLDSWFKVFKHSSIYFILYLKESRSFVFRVSKSERTSASGGTGDTPATYACCVKQVLTVADALTPADKMKRAAAVINLI